MFAHLLTTKNADDKMFWQVFSCTQSFTGIGHTTSKQLKEMGIESITDLQDTEQAVLKKVFGDAVAMTMKQLVDGIDEAPVVPYSLPQVGISLRSR